MKKTSLSLICGGSICLLAATANAQTTTILNETWANGSHTTQSLPNSARWFTASDASTLTSAPGTLTQDNAATTYTFAYFAAANNPVSLQVGQVLQANYSFSLSGVTRPSGTDSSFFRIGMFNSRNGQVTEDGLTRTNSIYQSYRGYVIDQLGPSQERSAILKRRTNFGNGLMTSTNASNYATLGSSAPVAAGYVDDIVYNGSFSIAYVDSTTITITASVYYMDGQNRVQVYDVSASDTSGSIVTAFDSIFFTLGASTAESLSWHSMNISLAQIPEPSSVAAIGAGVVLLLCLGLRRRQHGKAN